MEFGGDGKGVSASLPSEAAEAEPSHQPSNTAVGDGE
jgi:hypothetical protein